MTEAEKDKTLLNSFKVIKHVVKENKEMKKAHMMKDAKIENSEKHFKMFEKKVFELKSENEKLKTNISMLSNSNEKKNILETSLITLMGEIGNEISKEEIDEVNKWKESEDQLFIEYFNNTFN